jgi:hypothetical protein
VKQTEEGGGGEEEEKEVLINLIGTTQFKRSFVLFSDMCFSLYFFT